MARKRMIGDADGVADAIARALRLYASESGIPSPARDAIGGIGGFPSPSPSPLARGPTPSSAARASSSPPRFTRDESPAKASLADRLASADEASRRGRAFRAIRRASRRPHSPLRRERARVMLHFS